MQRLEYLGHIVDVEVIRADPKKLQVVQEWPLPRTVTELQSFLGLLGYHRKFIAGFSRLVVPLTNLLQSGQPWVWEQEQQVF